VNALRENAHHHVEDISTQCQFPVGHCPVLQNQLSRLHALYNKKKIFIHRKYGSIKKQQRKHKYNEGEQQQSP